MQIVIDILPEEYEAICKVDAVVNVIPFRIAQVIKDGTVLPENPTNGDMIIALYPDLRYVIQNGRIVTTIGVASSFDEDWWNAPYNEV